MATIEDLPNFIEDFKIICLPPHGKTQPFKLSSVLLASNFQIVWSCAPIKINGTTSVSHAKQPIR